MPDAAKKVFKHSAMTRVLTHAQRDDMSFARCVVGALLRATPTAYATTYVLSVSFALAFPLSLYI
eukprot:508836-Heterocapsa_arctica.AAC.1